MTEARQPWHRRPDETPKAYAAFEKYRDQPPGKRTLAAAARAVYGEKGIQRSGNIVGRIREWADDNEWEVRAAAWDEHERAIREQEYEEATRDMVRRHALEAETYERALLVPARHLLRRLADPEQAPAVEAALARMDVDQLVRLVDRAGRGAAIISRFERLTRGLSDGRTEVTGADGGPVVMTTEEAIRTLAPVLGVDEDAVVDELAARRREARRRARLGGAPEAERPSSTQDQRAGGDE